MHPKRPKEHGLCGGPTSASLPSLHTFEGGCKVHSFARTLVSVMDVAEQVGVNICNESGLSIGFTFSISFDISTTSK